MLKAFLRHFNRTHLLPMAIIGVCMLIINFAAVGFYKYKANENLRSNTRDQVEIIKAAIYQPFWNLDYKSISTIVDSVLSQQAGSVAAIRILDSEQVGSEPTVLIDRIGPQWSKLTFSEIRKNDDFIFTEVPVIYEGNLIGTVQVLFSTAQHKSEVTRISILLSLACLILTALAGTVFLTYYLGRQAKELQNQVEERTRELDQQRMAMVNSSRLAALGEMSAGIAHEINNPLTVIEGKSTILLRLLKSSPEFENAEKHLKKISDMVYRISKIVAGLRAFSRDGSQELPSEFKVMKFFSDISDLCHSNLSHKQVKIEFLIDDPQTKLFAREVQLSQVLINMINNSSDAIKDLDQKWIRVECIQRNDKITIAVTDSGPGIPPEIQKKMLQPFFTTKEVGKGTGLGLSISIGIVEAHGGTLTYCQSSPNTRFEITLNARAPEAELAAAS